MRAKFQLISMQNAKVFNEDRQHIEEAIGGQMGTIIGSPKHNYNAFPQLRTKFFHKQCIIWSFPPSFNEFHRNLNILKISVQFWNNYQWAKKLQQELSPTKLFQI